MKDRYLSSLQGALWVGLIMVFLLAGLLAFSPPVYGGPETIGQSPEAQLGAMPPRDIPLGVEGKLEEERDKGDAGVAEMATDEKFLPVGFGELSSSAPEAAPLRQRSGFDAFNARYQGKWLASFSKETGRVKLLAGARSRMYKDGPEEVARGFLREAHTLFGLREDLADLATDRVYRTPVRDHVRLQQTYNGVPIEGAVVLVHATPKGEVTMVQNGYLEGFQPANRQLLSEEEAVATARMDLQAVLGKEAVIGEPKAEQRLVPYKDGYWYIWRVVIPAQNPIGYWVYKIDADSGAIIYKANEILSLKTGKGRAYKTNADWLKVPKKVSNVALKNMFTCAESSECGYLAGLHADIYDNDGNDPYSAVYQFLYDPVTQPDCSMRPTPTSSYRTSGLGGTRWGRSITLIPPQPHTVHISSTGLSLPP